MIPDPAVIGQAGCGSVPFPVMSRRHRILGLALIAVPLAAFLVPAFLSPFRTDVWARENPLQNAIMVSSVHDGVVTLTDGRALRPAGINRSPGASPGAFDEALRILTAQGVTITRDFGDGRAFLQAEPKFYNWCGTCATQGRWWTRWAGSYFQVPVSEMLIKDAYARPSLDEPGLTFREQWRLEGVEHVFSLDEEPARLSIDLQAFRYDSSAAWFKDYEAMLAAVWKPVTVPPSVP